MITFLTKPPPYCVLRRCIQCGDEFEPSGSLNALCSKKCALARRAQQTRGRRFSTEKTCVQCGKRFVTTNPNKLNCSKECARKSDILRIRKWHERQKDEALRRRCAEILEAAPPGTMTEEDAMKYARDESESKRRRGLTREERRRTKKTCVQCGKTFVTSITRKITCSKECARDRNAARRKTLYDLHYRKKLEKACIQCGKTFEAPGAKRICSKECTRLRLNKQANQSYKRHRGKETEKECVQCGKTFKTPRDWNVVCGKACARLRNNERRRKPPRKKTPEHVEKHPSRGRDHG